MEGREGREAKEGRVEARCPPAPFPPRTHVPVAGAAPPALPRCLIALMLSLYCSVWEPVYSHAHRSLVTHFSDTQCTPFSDTSLPPHTFTQCGLSLPFLNVPNLTRTFETTHNSPLPADKVQHSGGIRRRRSQCQQKLIHQQTPCSIQCRTVSYRWTVSTSYMLERSYGAPT